MLQSLLLAFCAVAGAALAALSCWHVLLDLTEQRLAAYSGMLLERAQELDDESRQALGSFNSQPRQLCSAAEIERLRESVYRTYYVKDIGRVRGGRLLCSGTMPAVPVPIPLPAAKITTADGLEVSLSEMTLLAPGARAPVLGRGESRVVLDPDAFRIQPYPDARFVVGYLAADDRTFLPLYGTAMRLDVPTLRAGRAVDRDGALFYPQCALDQPICVASSLRKTALLDTQRPLLLVATLLGGLAGAAIGLALLAWRMRQRSVEARLHRAIDRDALDVEYQPVVRIADGKVVGAEALVRWCDYDGRMVPPSRFIPIAEEDGSIRRITELVIRRVVRDFGDLLAGPDEFRINVNISAADLDDGRFHLALQRALEAAGIPPRRLGIELTEHSTAAREAAIAGTHRLRESGHCVYIDDFGTGYSSLAYLTQLEIFALKVDRSFTHTIGTDALQVTLVPQIIDMARTLGLQVVIEGVETAAQADYLRGVDYPLLAQGWLYGRPMSAEALRARIVPREG